MTESNNNNNFATGSIAKTVKEQAQQEYETLIQRDFRHNATCFVGFDSIWGMGMAFAMYSTVVAAYMATLNAPKTLIGLVMSFHIIFCPLQLLVTHWLRTGPRKIRYLSLIIICIIPWLGYNILFLLNPQACSDPVKLILFTFVMLVFAGTVSAIRPIYLGMLIDCSPVRKRGIFFGYRIMGLSLAVWIMTPAARAVMKAWPEPQNFHVAFLIANFIYFLACLWIWRLREHSNPQISTSNRGHIIMNRFWPRLRLDIRKLMRDPNYRVFMFFTILSSISIALGSFIIVFAREKLKLNASDILIFSLIQVTCSAPVSLFLGKIADKVGYKLIGIIRGLLLTAAFLLIAVVEYTPVLSGIIPYISFALFSCTTFVSESVKTNLSVEIRPKQNVGVLIALGNLFIMPVILVTAPLGGFLIDITGRYDIVFILAALFALISAAGYALLVHEPRKSRLHIVRYFKRS